MPPLAHDFATKYTGMALVLSNLFKVTFADVSITGRAAKISEPQSPTSDAGAKALQHISLERPGKPTIIIGWANCANNTAELRTWQYLANVHAARFRSERFPLEKHQFADFFVRLAEFLRSQGMNVEIKDADEDQPIEAPVRATRHSSRPGGRGTVWLVALILVVVVIFGFLMLQMP